MSRTIATEDEKREAIRAQLDNPLVLSVLFDALTQMQQFEDTDFVRRKMAVLDFVRGISATQLEPLEYATDSISKGYALSKHFRVLTTCIVHERSLRENQKLILIGNGWISDGKGKHTHPFNILNEDRSYDGITIHINDEELSSLLAKGHILSLD